MKRSLLFLCLILIQTGCVDDAMGDSGDLSSSQLDSPAAASSGTTQAKAGDTGDAGDATDAADASDGSDVSDAVDASDAADTPPPDDVSDDVDAGTSVDATTTADAGDAGTSQDGGDAGETDPGVDATGGKFWGCATSNPTNVPGAFGFGLVMMVLLGARRGRRLLASVVVALAVFVVAAPAQAQSTAGTDTFDAQFMTPGPGRSTSFWSQPYASTAGHLRWDDGVFMNYARNPLLIRNAAGDGTQAVISDQLTLHLLGLLGLSDHFDIGIDIPMILLSEGDSIVGLPGVTDGSSFGIGDIRFQVRTSFLRMREEGEAGPALGLMADVRLPTGNADRFQGESPRVEPRLAFDWVFADTSRIGFAAGYTFREDTTLGQLQLADPVTLSAAASIALGKGHRAFLVPEIRGQFSPTAADGMTAANSPVEALIGFKVAPVPIMLVEFGTGTGVVAGAGAPDYRFFLGISFHANRGDRDEDGIYDADDSCPTSAEDFDGFEDLDGCPELDNDEDGVLDPDDACVEVAEDVDGFEDTDGCPDTDNDRDGMLDVNEQCPNDAEDVDGYEDENGCPDLDNDNDGVLDTVDTCPMAPEDIDTFEDTDGCPDPDNDRDNLLDLADQCPLEPEDVDGFEDEDGCPEEGEGLVRLTCAAIEINEAVFFDTNSDVIQARSYPLLDQVASVIRSATHIQQVRVDGHTDSRGRDAFNLELSERRAASVMLYLLNTGIDPARLLSQGFGETMPIASNDSAGGRQTNRRVEFVITRQTIVCEP